MAESSSVAAANELALEVNGEAYQVPAPCTITGLLERLELGGKRVAVAVNSNVVIRSLHPEHVLSAGDRIEILEAVGGG